MDTTKKFTDKAKIYSKYRPNYPLEYVDYLISLNNLTKDSYIADIGSGTGILTEQLLKRNFNVFGVEPNKDMRSEAEENLKKYFKFNSINGEAENTGLKDSSIDLITVAQAFHWFDMNKFKDECRRILKPNSKVALVWNSRDFSSELVKENAQICERLCPLFKGFSGGIEETPEIYSKFFKNGKYEHKRFPNNLELDLDGFIGRNLSASYAPKNTEKNYKKFIEEITELFYKYSKDNKIILPNITRSYMGRV